ncbi:MAG: hypothetical protein N3F07_03785 [Candidatus Micrarchaeota archaeon]|nr:hypothetical protein [Candidatus Micrarchaeota archaeon]
MNLDKQFASTCRTLFGREIGGLSAYKDYLVGMVDAPMTAKSDVSGKQVFLSRHYYCKKARFIDIAEIPRAQAALSINEIKDMDLALNAISEKFAYCGSKNLGTSIDVVESDMCNDSIGVLSSMNVINSKYVAYSNGIRQSEAVFGCQLGGEVGFSIHSQIFFYSKRCFDAYLCFHSTDLYCCFNCRNCAEALFSFNQNSKRCMIGNLELPKEKYLALKRKLVGEIAEELEKKRKFPTIFELARRGMDG